MVKRFCPYCKKLKVKVQPKMVGRTSANVYTKVMCDDCYKLYQKGRLEIDTR
ncbi:MAG: hypothetical protein UU74_C0034G0011 [Candidatus Woesebacteria bacterium GW2011_GWA1_41_7]|uniref:Uncharacterized protein n=3 Tax=Candidatus Woeseibacteriota TaxID=1752722 RepID=A0A0G0WVH1_9BACT|nr:MAG: hypothetical protein UT76_C0030G0009 [Candidatus Woesebacteria bacterium GW2011_GWB1_40_12]KKS05232.1 MAG: hypothetical protein UU57_C0014G0006 [Candidatus Woesebacteria bacterium GW2011_GWE1_41_24]KKS16725.1 MAG: hypothetical protein UU74_C0034G0011 [Candidatus Woesebacteria bacterium GW2011_GWA1_41_7]